MEIQASYEDFLGAVSAEQHSVAAHAARALVLRCLAVRSLRATGDVPDPEDALSDPFSGLPEDVVEAGLRVIGAVARAVEDSVNQVSDYLHAFEQDLGFQESPPSVRRPEGLFPALRMARELLPLNEAAGLPLALPGAWLPESQRKTKGDR
jgi:hypothetical protein